MGRSVLVAFCVAFGAAPAARERQPVGVIGLLYLPEVIERWNSTRVRESEHLS